MKSVLHRLNQFSEDEQRRIKRPRSDRVMHREKEYDKRDASEAFMRQLVRHALKEEKAIIERRELWARYEGSRWAPKPDPIVEELRKVFETIYREFKGPLESHREDDTWDSYSISYLAMRRCARAGKYRELAYIYRSCQRAHRKYLRKLATCGLWVDADETPDPPTFPDIEVIDRTMDIEAALRPLDPNDARIVRMWYEQEATFQQIGAALGVHESTANRRFKKALDTLRVALRAYQPEGDRSKPTAVAEQSRRAA